MQIEKETVFAKKLIKNDFLNKPLGVFTQELGNANFQKVMNIIQKNKSVFVPNKAIKHFTPEIQSVFQIFANSLTRDNKLDQDEIYSFVRGYYRAVKKQSITDKQISELKTLDLLDIIIIWVKRVNARAKAK